MEKKESSFFQEEEDVLNEWWGDKGVDSTSGQNQTSSGTVEDSEYAEGMGSFSLQPSHRVGQSLEERRWVEWTTRMMRFKAHITRSVEDGAGDNQAVEAWSEEDLQGIWNEVGAWRPKENHREVWGKEPYEAPLLNDPLHVQREAGVEQWNAVEDESFARISVDIRRDPKLWRTRVKKSTATGWKGKSSKESVDPVQKDQKQKETPETATVPWKARWALKTPKYSPEWVEWCRGQRWTWNAAQRLWESGWLTAQESKQTYEAWRKACEWTRKAMAQKEQDSLQERQEWTAQREQYQKQWAEGWSSVQGWTFKYEEQDKVNGLTGESGRSMVLQVGFKFDSVKLEEIKSLKAFSWNGEKKVWEMPWKEGWTVLEWLKKKVKEHDQEVKERQDWVIEMTQGEGRLWLESWNKGWKDVCHHPDPAKQGQSRGVYEIPDHQYMALSGGRKLNLKGKEKKSEPQEELGGSVWNGVGLDASDGSKKHVRPIKIEWRVGSWDWEPWTLDEKEGHVIWKHPQCLSGLLNAHRGFWRDRLAFPIEPFKNEKHLDLGASIRGDAKVWTIPRHTINCWRKEDPSQAMAALLKPFIHQSFEYEGLWSQGLKQSALVWMSHEDLSGPMEWKQAIQGQMSDTTERLQGWFAWVEDIKVLGTVEGERSAGEPAVHVRVKGIHLTREWVKWMHSQTPMLIEQVLQANHGDFKSLSGEALLEKTKSFLESWDLNAAVENDGKNGGMNKLSHEGSEPMVRSTKRL